MGNIKLHGCLQVGQFNVNHSGKVSFSHSIYKTLKYSSIQVEWN